jgi:hypothetical protein
MRSFQQIISFFFALFICALAQETESYDATVYITSTVLLVNTVTMSGTPTGVVANQTSTIPATMSTLSTLSPSLYPTATGASNVTAIAPTGTMAKPSQAEFTGAASALNANALVAVMAAGVGYLVL